MATSAERLALLYEVNRRLATFTDLDDLVRFATGRLRELFAAEGCALLLLDAGRREFHFPVASQSASRAATADRLEAIRFPADKGIAGWIAANGESALVADAQRDPRFFAGVDAETGVTTRAMLGAPLRSQEGVIGVVEVINPGPESLTGEDLRFLEALADDIAAACERARLLARLRAEAVSLRQVCTGVGIAALGFGLLFLGGSVVTAVARAVPLGEALLETRLLGAVLVSGLGAVLLRAGRSRT